MKKFLAFAGLALAAVFGSMIGLPSTASATPTCTPYTDSSATYPADGTHFYVCVPSPNSARRTTIISTIRGLPRKANTSDPDLAYDVLKNNGVTIFWFYDRDDGNSFMSTNSPWSGSGSYQSTTARCGYTGKAGAAGTVLQVYDNCRTNGGSTLFQNPSLQNTSLHEAGHAYDFSRSYQPSRTAGYATATSPLNLIESDLNALTPSNWSTMTNAQKDSTVCTIFSNIAPSALEIDLGASSGAVCSGSGSTMTRNAAYLSKTPTDIAKEKLPYFLDGSLSGVIKWQEAWAEQFAITGGVQTGLTNFLQLTDRVLSNSQNFRCSRFVVQRYMKNGAPPTQADMTANSCPAQGSPGNQL